MKIQVTCQDKHEAIKLASIIFIKEGNETFITSILNIYDNELVISLKDKSAHSIVFKDNSEVEKFADFIQSVLDKTDKLIDAKQTDEQVEITKG